VTATLFDFDGVLVDSEPAHLAAFNDVLAARGLPAIDEATYVERYLSLDDAGVFRKVLSVAGRAPDEGEVRAMVHAKEPRFMARFQETFRVFPGAPDLIERRSKRGPVGIVSGALESEIRFALGKMDVLSRVSFIVSAESTAVSKPDPAPFRLGLENVRRLGHTGAVVAVEDSTGGVVSATRAGLRCVAVTHSYPRQALLDAGAHATADDLLSLTDALLEDGA
jgi:beta-phosphoglucomutase